MRREWPSLLVLLGLGFFAWLAVSPAFETGLVTVAIGACMILGRTRDVRAELEATRGSRTLLVYAPLLALGAFVTAPSWSAERPFVGLDGQVNLAIIGELVDQITLGRPLTWLTRIAPGDPMLDLYPTLAHRAIARLAILTGHAHDPARVLVVVVSAAYVAVSLGIARTAFRLGAPEPAALAVGAFALLDLGSDFTWGTRPVFHYGFLPSTISVAITLHTLPSMFDLLRRARASTAALTTLGFALAAAMHPIALIVSLAIVAVLAGSFAFATPAARRLLLPPVACASLGILGSAWLWLPASQRVLAYALHYRPPPDPFGPAPARLAHTTAPPRPALRTGHERYLSQDRNRNITTDQLRRPAWVPPEGAASMSATSHAHDKHDHSHEHDHGPAKGLMRWITTTTRFWRNTVTICAASVPIEAVGALLGRRSR